MWGEDEWWWQEWRWWWDFLILLFLEKGHNDTHDRRPQEGVEGTTTKIETMFLDFFSGHKILRVKDPSSQTWRSWRRRSCLEKIANVLSGLWLLSFPRCPSLFKGMKDKAVKCSMRREDEGRRRKRRQDQIRMKNLDVRRRRRGRKLVSAWNSFTSHSLQSHIPCLSRTIQCDSCDSWCVWTSLIVVQTFVTNDGSRDEVTDSKVKSNRCQSQEWIFRAAKS